jgi:hypothetical protein
MNVVYAGQGPIPGPVSPGIPEEVYGEAMNNVIHGSKSIKDYVYHEKVAERLINQARDLDELRTGVEEQEDARGRRMQVENSVAEGIATLHAYGDPRDLATIMEQHHYIQRAVGEADAAMRKIFGGASTAAREVADILDFSPR